SNDGTAGGAIQALSEESLAGKVLVTGQDAELSACQRIVNGTQAMTIYKPLSQLAKQAAEAATKMARSKPVFALGKINNGKIEGLSGENGAGKSTLIKLLSGIYPYGSYEGKFFIHGQLAKFRSLADAQNAGIAVIYQELALVNDMTVGENIFLGSEPRTARGLIDWHKVYHEARLLLQKFKVDIDPSEPVAKLGMGQKQLVEIVKALSKNSNILVLDEPTAALAEHEVLILLDILRD